MLKMNTSFSKYVKQCKWGLSLDAAGSDYSAHQLARLLTTILGRLPGPSAQRWEASPSRGGGAAALGLPASLPETIGPQVHEGGVGGLGGRVDPLLPTLGGRPRAGRGAKAGAGLRPGLGTPWKVIPLWDRHNLNSRPTATGTRVF